MNTNLKRITPIQWISILVLPLALLFVVTLTTGCGSAPQDRIDAADNALQKAREAEAADYAPDSYKAAEDARAALDTELKAQEDRMAFMRSYSKARELADAADSAAARAQTDAIAGRARARDEAAAMIAGVKTTLTEVKQLLANAPKGKGSEADLAMLRSDVGGIDTTVGEMDAAFAADRYVESKAKAQAAQDSAQRVKDELLQAMETAKVRRQGTRRG